MKKSITKQTTEYKLDELLQPRNVSPKLTVFDILAPLLELFSLATFEAQGITNPYQIKAIFAEYTPQAVIDKIRQQLLFHMQPGFIILEGLSNELADSDVFMIGLTSLISTPIAFPGEGEIVIRIKPRKEAAVNPSFANAAEFFLHTDLSYIPIPPDILTMICKRPAADGGGESLFASMGDIQHLLTLEAYHQLRQPNFSFAAPDHYNRNNPAESAPTPVPVITYTDAGLRVRFRRDKITASTDAGQEAIDVFNAMAKIKTLRYRMPKGSAVILNQRYVLHGRDSFEPSFDEFDREFLRCYGTLSANKYKYVNYENGRISF
jgi:alpha-ketoglutarate-dependent taurine dioxygenase